MSHIKEQYRQIFEEYYSKIYNILLKRVGNEEDAKDLAQIVFLKLWKNKKYIKNKTFKFALLFTITKNTLVDYYKNKICVVELNQHELPVSDDGELDSIYSKEVLINLQKNIDNLPEQRKKIIRLNKLEGLTSQEIAQHLSLSKRTVQTQIYLAIKQLKESMLLFSIFLEYF